MIEISDTLQAIVPGIPISRIVKYDMPIKPTLRRKTWNIHFCGFFEEQFLHSSSLCKHESKVHATEYEKSINSYYPLVNELSDPQMQNVLESTVPTRSLETPERSLSRNLIFVAFPKIHFFTGDNQIFLK